MTDDIIAQTHARLLARKTELVGLIAEAERAGAEIEAEANAKIEALQKEWETHTQDLTHVRGGLAALEQVKAGG